LPNLSLHSLPDDHPNIVRALGFDDFAPGIPIFFVAYAFDMYYAVVEGNFLSVRDRLW